MNYALAFAQRSAGKLTEGIAPRFMQPRRVLDFVSKTGLSQDDPLFLVLVATGQLEVMLSDAPQTLQLLFQTWNQDLAHNLEQVEQVAISKA